MIITGRDMSMVRGDSEAFYVTMRDNTSEGNIIPFEEGDTVYFTVREEPEDEIAALEIVVTDFINGEAYIEIAPEDTESLKTMVYTYDVRRVDKAGRVRTIVAHKLPNYPPTQFFLLPEVSRHG